MSFAIAAIAKNEAPYIAEWVAFHLLAGADFVRVYDNGSEDSTAAILRDLGRRFPVEVVDWRIAPRGGFNEAQKLAYKDAAERFRGVVEWLALVDVDEFLRPAPPGLDVAGILDGFGPDVGAVAVQQIVFGSGGAERWDARPVIARFTRCAAADHAAHRWFKSIVRPERLLAVESVHSVRAEGRYVFADGTPLERPEGNPRLAARVAASAPIRLHHYAQKSREEFAAKQRRMLAADLPETVRANYLDFDARDRSLNEVENRDLAWYAPAVTALLRSGGYRQHDSHRQPAIGRPGDARPTEREIPRRAPTDEGAIHRPPTRPSGFAGLVGDPDF